MRKLEASFTVEAALVVPVVIFIMIGSMRLGIMLYGEEKETAQGILEQEEWNAAEKYRQWKMAGDVIENENGIY